MKNRIAWFGLLVWICGIAHALETTANLEYANVEQLTSPVTGIVSAAALVGNHYAKDSQLAAFDSTVIVSKINSLKKSKQLKQKVLAEAARELQRSQDLYEGTMLSDHELKLAEINHLQAQTELAEIQHKLLKLGWKRKFFKLKSPYKGYLVESHIYPGKYVANRHLGTSLLGFIKDDRIRIKLQLNQKMALKDGDEFQITYAGINFQAQVSGVNQGGGQGILYALLTSVPEVLPPQGSLVKVLSP